MLTILIFMTGHCIIENYAIKFKQWWATVVIFLYNAILESHIKSTKHTKCYSLQITAASNYLTILIQAILIDKMLVILEVIVLKIWGRRKRCVNVSVREIENLSECSSLH